MQMPVQKRICVSAFLSNPLKLHPVTQPSMHKRLCVPVFLLNPLELPHDANIYAEKTMRLRFSAEPPETGP